jgi:hypothetical protein
VASSPRKKKIKWTPEDAIEFAKTNGSLKLPWGYNYNQQRRAAEQAQKQKKLKRVKSARGFDEWRAVKD